MDEITASRERQDNMILKMGTKQERKRIIKIIDEEIKETKELGKEIKIKNEDITYKAGLIEGAISELKELKQKIKGVDNE